MKYSRFNQTDGSLVHMRDGTIYQVRQNGWKRMSPNNTRKKVEAAAKRKEYLRNVR